MDEVAAEDGEHPTIHIRGDRTLPYQKIMDVVNMLKSRDLSKLSLDTKSRLIIVGSNFWTEFNVQFKLS